MKSALLVLVASSLLMSGCSMLGDTTAFDRQMQYDAYIQARLKMFEQQQKAPPIMDAEWLDSGGNPIKLTINLPVQPELEQIK